MSHCLAAKLDHSLAPYSPAVESCSDAQWAQGLRDSLVGLGDPEADLDAFVAFGSGSHEVPRMLAAVEDRGLVEGYRIMIAAEECEWEVVVVVLLAVVGGAGNQAAEPEILPQTHEGLSLAHLQGPHETAGCWAASFGARTAGSSMGLDSEMEAERTLTVEEKKGRLVETVALVMEAGHNPGEN